MWSFGINAKHHQNDRRAGSYIWNELVPIWEHTLFLHEVTLETSLNAISLSEKEECAGKLNLVGCFTSVEVEMLPESNSKYAG